MEADNHRGFIPGLELSELFYWEAVRPILDTYYPNLRHSAALLGPGSEVLGFDTRTSMDHNWGPRLQLFVSSSDVSTLRYELHKRLAQQLPHSFRGFPVNFSCPNPDDGGTQTMKAVESGPVNHRVEITTVKAFLGNILGIDPYADLELVDWLLLSEQDLLEVTSGKVFYDGLGELRSVRGKFAYYPRDVWLFRLAAVWQRVSQEEAFVGRCGEVGDELGSQIVTARIVRDLMKLGFLMEKQYAPYSKWFGSAFSQLECANVLNPVFQQTLAAKTWQERESGLCKVYVHLAAMHNKLAITQPLPEQTTTYFGRPYQVIFAERFARAICSKINDDRLRRLSVTIGGVDQWVDCTDVTEHPELMRRLRVVYEQRP